MDGDEFWGNTNPCDVSIDTTNSKEMMTGSHITKQQTCEYQGPNRPELLNKVSNVPEMCNAVQKCQLYPLDKPKDSNMLSKTNNVTYVNGIDLLEGIFCKSYLQSANCKHPKLSSGYTHHHLLLFNFEVGK